jgi:hypothetical protein
MPSFLVKPLVTSLVLYHSMFPDESLLVLKPNLDPTVETLFGTQRDPEHYF